LRYNIQKVPRNIYTLNAYNSHVNNDDILYFTGIEFSVFSWVFDRLLRNDRVYVLSKEIWGSQNITMQIKHRHSVEAIRQDGRNRQNFSVRKSKYPVLRPGL
jgi:hypothetical protein